MAVIYLPTPVGGTASLGASLGEALGKFGTAAYGAYEEKTALAKSMNMPPEQRNAYLISQLGDRGAQLAQQLTQGQMDQQKLTLGQLELTDETYKTYQDKIAAMNAPKTAELAMQVSTADIAAKQASAIASRASANYDNAGAAAAVQQAKLYQIEAQKNLIEMNNQTSMAKAILGITSNPTDPAATTQALSDDPHVQGGNNGAPPPHVPGAHPPLTDPNQITSQAQVLTKVFTGQAGPKDLAAAFPADPPPNTQSSDAKLAAAGYAAQGQLGAAGEVLMKADQPKTTKLSQRAPGVMQMLATYPDSSTGWVGKPIYRPAPTPIAATKQASALAAWSDTVDALGKISPAVDKDGRVSREVNKTLMNLGITPLGSSSSPDVAFANARQHAIMQAGAIESSLGGSRAKSIQNQVQELLPTLTDSPEIKAGKIQAGQAFIDRQVKSVVGQLIANGQAVPPELLSIWNDHDLGNKSDQDLEKEYLPYLSPGNLAPEDAYIPPDGSGNSSAGTNGAGAGTVVPPSPNGGSNGSPNDMNSPSSSTNSPVTLKYDAQGNLITQDNK